MKTDRKNHVIKRERKLIKKQGMGVPIRDLININSLEDDELEIVDLFKVHTNNDMEV